jgi:uncharacterized protein (DUF1330 family)
MSSYVIANIEVQDPAAYEQYKRMVGPTITAFGGRFLARGGTVEVLEGDWAPRRLVIIEFPDGADARRWYASQEYAPAKAARQASSRGTLLLLDGV